MRFDPQANMVRADLPQLPVQPMPVALKPRSPIRTALIILGVCCGTGLGLWVANEKFPAFLDVEGVDAPRNPGVGEEVVEYAEAVIAGRMGVTEVDVQRERAEMARNDPRGPVQQAFSAGQLAMSMGRYDAAVKYFTEVITEDPEYAEAHYRLGLAYVRAGDIISARKERAKLEMLDPERANLLAHLVNH